MTRRRWESLYAEETRRDEPIALIKPLSFMNESGRPVKAWLEGTSVPPERLLGVHADLGLPLWRVKAGGQGGTRGAPLGPFHPAGQRDDGLPPGARRHWSARGGG